jgi:hypothetical protein
MLLVSRAHSFVIDVNEVAEGLVIVKDKARVDMLDAYVVVVKKYALIPEHCGQKVALPVIDALAAVVNLFALPEIVKYVPAEILHCVNIDTDGAEIKVKLVVKLCIELTESLFENIN